MPVVRVSWFEGKNTGTDAKYIYVIFEDVAPSNWAGDGKLFGPQDNGGK